MRETHSDSSEERVDNVEDNSQETGGEASEKTQRELEDEGDQLSFDDDEDEEDADKVDEEEASDDSDSDGDGTDDAEELESIKKEDEEDDSEIDEDPKTETAEEDDPDREKKKGKPIEDEDKNNSPEESDPDEDKLTSEADESKKDGSKDSEGDKKLSQEEIAALKARLRADIEANKKIGEGYKAWETGDTTYKNRAECKISSKTLDKVMQARGLDQMIDKNGKKVSENIKDSFNGPIYVKHGYEGDRYTMMYGDKKASGNYVSDQSAREVNPGERADKFSLAPGNDGSHIRDVQLGKDQFIFFGETASQGDSKDGTERTGGGTQYLTDGGYESGAVKDAYRSIDTVGAEMSQAERDHYAKTDTHVGEVGGREALIRNDIDYDQVDKKGRTNLERMEAGLAPLDSSGKSIELHHMGQKMDAPIAELKREEHRGKGVDTILHDKNVDTDIDRHDFNKERKEYWQQRARQIRAERGEES